MSAPGWVTEVGKRWAPNPQELSRTQPTPTLGKPRKLCLDAPAADYLVPPQPGRHQRLVYGPSSLAVNEHVVAADLLGERTAGAENHGDALMVSGGWRTKLTRDREEPAASVVQRHLQLDLAAEKVRGQSLRSGAAVTDEAADAGHGEAAGGRLPPAREREGSASIRKVARTRLHLTTAAQGDRGTVGRHGGIRRPWWRRPDHPRVRRVVVGCPACKRWSCAHHQGARDNDGGDEHLLHCFSPPSRHRAVARCRAASSCRTRRGGHSRPARLTTC